MVNKKQNKKQKLIILSAILILAGFGFAGEALAASYYSQGTLTSTNLLSGLTVTSIDSFGYNASSIPTGTSLKVQFSQDNSTWKNSSGTTNGWNNLTQGTNTISLSSLGWSGANFYYKIQFSSDGTNSPIVDDINVSYTQSTYNSPMNMTKNNQWQWSNFTWSNSSIPAVTDVAWKIYYNDTSGNENVTDVNTFKITDTVAPTITIQSPLNATYNSSTQSYNVWANVTLNKAGSWCGVSLDGAANSTLSNATGNWNYLMTVNGAGSHTALFYCNNTEGYMGNSSTRYFTLNTPPLWQNQGTNDTDNVINQGEAINLTAQGKDETALDWSWLSTNETGSWRNYSTGGAGGATNWITATQSDFNLGTYNKTEWNTTGFMQLAANDTEQELPNNQVNDGWINMTGNVLLMHLNSVNTTNYTLDTSGEGNNGKLYNYPCSPATCNLTAGKLNNSLKFDGSDDYISTADSASLDFGTGDFSVSFWIKPNILNSDHNFINKFVAGGSWGDGWFIEHGSGGTGLRFVTRPNTADTQGTQVNYSTSVPVGSWSHVVAVRNGSTLILFVNGVQVASATGASDNVNTGDGVYIGKDPVNGRYTNGTIDEVAIYNRSLTAAEILNHYNRQKDRFIDRGNYVSKVFDASSTAQWNNISWTEGVPYGEELPNNKAVETVLGGANMTGNVLLMHMNEGSGTTVSDSSGSGNSGTFFGGTQWITNSTCKLSNCTFTDGDGDYVKVATQFGIMNNFTIAGWLRPLESNGIFFSIPYSSDSVGIELSVNGNMLGVRTYTTSSNSAIQYSNSNLPLNSWSYFAVTYNGSAHRLYVNGILENETALSGNIRLGEGNTYLGVFSASYVTGSNAMMNDYDNIELYLRTLSADEILNHYKRGALRLNITTRSCDDAACSGENWNNTYINATLSTLSESNNRYFQYKANFETDNTSYTPELYNVTVNYNATGGGGGNYNSPMDMNNVANVWTWSNFTWSNSSVAQGTNVGWKIYYNDTSGNENVTDVNTFRIRETTPPTWSSNTTSIVPTYSSALSQFNITWTDNVAVDKVFIEGNWTGSAANYTPSVDGNVRYLSVILPAGSFYWRSFANDSSNNWNVSNTWYFTVNKTQPVLILSNNTASVNTSGLVGYWRFENESLGFASDYSGWNNTGTLKNMNNAGNSTSGPTAGRFGKAMKFDGVNDYVRIADSDSWYFGSNDFAIDFWIKFNDISTSNQCPFSQYSWNANNDAWYMFIRSSDLQFNHYVGGVNDLNAYYAVTSTAGVWYHFAIVRHGATITVYRNGTSLGDYAAVTFENNDGNLLIGTSTEFGQYVNGSIDEFHIWKNRSLTADEVKELYESRVSYGTQTKFNCTADNNEITPSLFRNETNVTSTENNTLMTLGAGYNYYLCNNTATQNYTQSALLLPMNVTQGTPTLALTLNGTAGDQTYVYPAAVNATGSESNSGDSDVTYSLYRNSSQKATGAGAISENILLGNGTYAYVYNNTAGQNWTSTSVTRTAYVVKGNVQPTLSVNPAGWTYTYPTQTNVSCAVASQNNEAPCSVSRNETVKGTSETITLPNGTYLYRANSTGTANYTVNSTGQTNVLIIGKNITAVSLYLDFNGTTNSNAAYTYPQAVNATAYFGGSSEGTVVLWRNGTNLGNSTSVPMIETLGNATWNFTVSYYAQNYTATQITFWVSVNKGASSISLTGVTNHTYGSEDTVICTSNNTANAASIYRNYTAATWNNTATVFGVGGYRWDCNTTTTQNITGNSITAIQSITQATSTCSANPATQTIVYGASVNQYCTSNFGSCNLYRNSSSAANSTDVVYGVGQYVFVANATGTVNYTSCTDTETLTVNPAGQSISLTGITNGTYPYSVTPVCTGNITSNLYRNSSSAANNTAILLGVAGYNWVCNTTANSNYTAASVSVVQSIIKGNVQPTLSVSPAGWTYNYPTQTNVSCSVTSQNNEVGCTLSKNETQIGTSETTTLAVGQYLYRANSTGTSNYTVNVTGQTNVLTVGINVTAVVLYLDFNGTTNASRTYTYPQTVNATGYFSGSSEGTIVLWRNGTNLGNASSVSSIMPLGNATWNFTVSYYAQNYTTAAITYWVTVNKGILQISISGNQTVTYPTQTAVTGTESNTGDLDVTYQLWRNNSMVDNISPYSESITLGVGDYLYRFNASVGQNYTANMTGATSIFTVNQNATNLVDIYLDNGTAYKNQNITVIYGTQTTANATMVYSNAGTANLYEDGSVVANPRITNLTIGIHSYKGNVTGNANYTSNVTGATYYAIVICNPPTSGDWTVPTGSTCTCDGGIWNVAGNAYVYGSLILINNCNITFTSVNKNIYVYSSGTIQIAPGSGFNKPS